MNDTLGKIILFGSGETSEAGLRITRKIFQTFQEPQNVAILETPAGFQPNSHTVAEEIAAVYKNDVSNVASVTSIPARKKGTVYSPDNVSILKPLENADYIFLGPGSPSYTVTQLSDTKALSLIVERFRAGATLVLSSAAAMAAGKFTLPVYEIYKVGSALYWIKGLDILSVIAESLVVVTHWNNTDGGKTLDTRYCFMGEKRFEELVSILPVTSRILGIDENTAAIFDLNKNLLSILGSGEVTLHYQGKIQTFQANHTYGLTSFLKGEKEERPFAMTPMKKSEEQSKEQVDTLPQEIAELLAKRLAAKKEKNFSQADAIRQEIIKRGYTIEDTPERTVVYKV